MFYFYSRQKARKNEQSHCLEKMVDCFSLALLRARKRKGASLVPVLVAVREKQAHPGRCRRVGSVHVDTLSCQQTNTTETALLGREGVWAGAGLSERWAWLNPCGAAVQDVLSLNHRGSAEPSPQPGGLRAFAGDEADRIA